MDSSQKRMLQALRKIRSNLFSRNDEVRMRHIDKIDPILSKMNNTFLNNSPSNYADLIKNILTKDITTDTFKTDFASGLIRSPENMARMDRYSACEEVTSYITYCARALKVLSDGICSPDNITKDVIQILETESDSDNKELIDVLNKIKTTLELDDVIYNVVQGTLKLGDQFVEVCDYRNSEIPLTQTLLMERPENINFDADKQYILENYQEDLTKEDLDNLKENEKKLPDLPYLILEGGQPGSRKRDEIDAIVDNDEEDNDFHNESSDKNILTIRPVLVTEYSKPNGLEKTLNEYAKTEEDDESENEKDYFSENSDVQHVRLIVHDPRRVVKIQSKKYKMNMGYLILPEDPDFLFGASRNISLTKSMSSDKGSINPWSFNSKYSGVDEVYKELIKAIKHHLHKSDDIDINKRELVNILAHTLKDIEDDAEGYVEMKIRYVPPERMEHFEINNQTFFPYGESIFHKVMFNCKLLIALETAITIKRISDSSEKRIMYIEASSNRKVRNVIEEIKESLKRRKHSVDKFDQISSIPSMITSYEDFYVPQIRGQKTVEFDTLPAGVQIQQVVDELKFFRDTIIGALEVPPAYLGNEESLSNKAALAHESALFAETILSYQKSFTKHLFSLYNKIFRLVNNDEKRIPTNINITFPPPKMLQTEKENEHYQMVSQLITTLKEFGIPMEYLKKKYLNFDWSEIDKFETNTNLDKKSEPKPDPFEDTGSGLGGGFGGMPPMGLG